MYYRVGLRLLPHNKMCAPADRYHHHSSVLLVNPHPVQHRPFFPFSSYIILLFIYLLFFFFTKKMLIMMCAFFVSPPPPLVLIYYYYIIITL